MRGIWIAKTTNRGELKVTYNQDRHDKIESLD